MRPLPLATNTVGLLLLLLVTSICRLFWCTFINTTLLSLKKGKKFPDTEHDLTFKHLQLQFHNVARLNVWVAGLTLAILLVVVAWDSITSPYCSLFYNNAILFFYIKFHLVVLFKIKGKILGHLLPDCSHHQPRLGEKRRESWSSPCARPARGKERWRWESESKSESWNEWWG